MNENIKNESLKRMIFKVMSNNYDFKSIIFISIVFIVVINQVLSAPINEKIVLMLFDTMDITNDQRNVMASVMNGTKYMQIIFSILFSFISIIMSIIILYFSLLLFKFEIKFYKLLVIVAFSYIYIVIGDSFNISLVYYKGLELIFNPYDDTMLIGLNSLFTINKLGVFFYLILSYINIFQLLYIVSLSVNISNYLKIGIFKSFTIISISWLVTIIINSFLGLLGGQ